MLCIEAFAESNGFAGVLPAMDRCRRMAVPGLDSALICKEDFVSSASNGAKVKSAAHRGRKMRDKLRALVIPRR
jgi:hypothetical protein